jgi:hypothetical protein
MNLRVSRWKVHRFKVRSYNKYNIAHVVISALLSILELTILLFVYVTFYSLILVIIITAMAFILLYYVYPYGHHVSLQSLAKYL